jgi:predicted dehydrogenase
MRIAFTGVSHWHTPFFLDPAFGMAGVEVVAVSDPDADAAHRMLAGRPAAAFTDIAEMCDASRPDFVFALGRHCDMAATARLLIGRRIPFAMEKPCGLNLVEVREIAGLAAEANSFAAVPFVFRQGRMLHTLRELSGNAKPAYLSFKFVAGGVDRYRDAGCGWMLDRATSGGGSTLNLGVHFFDLFRVLAAPEEPIVVAAAFSNNIAGLDTEDHGVVVLRAGRATCVIETGYFFPAPVDTFDMRFSIRTPTHHFIAPDKDTLQIIDNARHMEVRQMPTTNVPYYADFLRDTLFRLSTGAPPIADLSDMQAAMELIDTAYAMAPLA